MSSKTTYQSYISPASTTHLFDLTLIVETMGFIVR